MKNRNKVDSRSIITLDTINIAIVAKLDEGV